MMVLSATENLLQNLLGEIEILKKENDDEISKVGLFLKPILLYNSKLKELLLSTPFSDIKEEINFFKSTKPRFISLHLYYLALEEFGLKRPKGDRKRIRKFYEKELQKIEDFLDCNGHMVHYLRSGAVQMDEQLFVRGIKIYPNWLVKPRADVDERFSTAGDHLVARIMAAENIYEHIVKKLSDLENVTGLASQENISSTCKWTGESINLVEIAYGIWLTGQMNNGNSTISEIIRWLESSLGVNVGRAYRRWTEISRRDQMNTTKYLDRMREAINIRLMNEDDLKRSKRQLPKNRDL
ncbi:RteC domain-containing protein [Pedobacter sp. Hv1]|uniref:RteC domain-containing protein n=1 Tax=Pedobacter sp. Hv1 TaxID=1740090 RepID=UPI0006D8BD02|nr:RteC domain-containing protein [Pedobacter sp. Hv1]KQB99880.1 hypothetical protein AQF98_15310 [Pedobacter sp. Hv1]